MRYIRQPKRKIADRKNKPEWGICPAPEVQYQCMLLYLAELCAFMSHKYNLEYVSEDKTLADDNSQ